MTHDPTYLILAALAARPLHGYGLIRSVADLSGGDVQLRAGALYGALDRLTERGLLKIDRTEHVEGRQRRYYRLSDSGATALAQQAARLHRLTPGMSFTARVVASMSTTPAAMEVVA